LLIQVIQYGYQERAYLVVFLRNNFDEKVFMMAWWTHLRRLNFMCAAWLSVR